MKRPMTPHHLIAGAVALAIVGFGFLLWNALMLEAPDAPVFAPVQEESAPAPAPAAVEEETAPTVDAGCETVPAPELPLLDDSDDFVRTQVDDCLAAMFPDDGVIDILRRSAAVLENAARGELSRAGVALFKRPDGGFRIETRDDRHYIDDASFGRYDPIVDALTCLSPQRSAWLVRLFRPLLAQSLRELGLPDADVDTVVDEALREILSVPVPMLPIEVVRTDRGYAYAYAKLEAASALSKQLVRLGPDNLIRLQRHVADVRAELRQPEPACID